MYAEKKHSLLIVLQGLDACGKDGVIRHLLGGMNPAGCRVVGFKRPKQEELDHDFLWRVHPHLPAKGEVSIFNRSHYEDVLVVRVHQFAQVNMWYKRYDLINDFERLLVTENDTTVLKFFLYISKAEQLARFKQRLDDPARRWKISEADYQERAYWGRTPKPSRMCSPGPAPGTRRGLSSPRTTNGFATWRYRRSSPAPWKTWI